MFIKVGSRVNVEKYLNHLRVEILMNLLFICNQNKHRSPTAAELFAHDYNTRSRGLYGGTLVRLDDIHWADCIMVMDHEQRIELLRRLPPAGLKRLLTLHIDDTYTYQSKELIALLRRKMASLATDGLVPALRPNP